MGRSWLLYVSGAVSLVAGCYMEKGLAWRRGSALKAENKQRWIFEAGVFSMLSAELQA